MPRLSERDKREWELFIGDKGRRQYNALCRKCRNGCKQSFRASVIECRRFMSKRSADKAQAASHKTVAKWRDF